MARVTPSAVLLLLPALCAALAAAAETNFLDRLPRDVQNRYIVHFGRIQPPALREFFDDPAGGTPESDRRIAAVDADGRRRLYEALMQLDRFRTLAPSIVPSGWERAARIFPGEPLFIEGLAEQLLTSNKPEEALALLDAAARREAPGSRLLTARASALFALGRREEALTAARAALAQNPHDRSASGLTLLLENRVGGRSNLTGPPDWEGPGDAGGTPAADGRRPPGQGVAVHPLTAAAGLRTRSVPQPLGRAAPSPDPSSWLSFMWSDTSKLEKHSEEAVSWRDFYRYARGMTREQLVNQMDRGNVTSAGVFEDVRYVTDPADPRRVIDMRHFAAVGTRWAPETEGLVGELVQWWHSKTSSNPRVAAAYADTAFDPQDFYSNALGGEFFRHHYDPKGPPAAEQLKAWFEARERRRR